MSKPKETFIITAEFDKYNWVDATLNGTPVKVAWNDDARYIHVESWNALLPVPVSRLNLLIKGFKALIRALEKAREGDRG